MADDLEDRLNSHAQAFEGLMSLIPAKQYYAQDTSDQWSKKKQTKAQKKEAKRAKLDPENQLSAKDVMDENERKRKRELEGEDDYSSDPDAPGKEQPREGLKALTAKEAKKLKLDAPEDEPEDEAAKAARLERQKKIDERRAAKKAKQLELSEKKARASEAAAVNGITEDKQKKPQQKSEKQSKKKPEQKAEPAAEEDDASDAGAHDDDEIDQVDFSGLVDDNEQQDGASASPSPAPDSSNSSAAPTASSASSTVPPQLPLDSPVKPSKLKLPEVDPEVLKERLQSRIEALRAARKADGIDGKPARNRQELLDARRKKEEQRRNHKKELRNQAKQDEQRLAAEAELARLRGSGSPGTPDIFSPREESTNNFSFGRITFGDGAEAAADASELLGARRKKGRSDPKTALEAAEKKRQRLAGLDETKRADIAEKDAWLNAKKRAHGEKVRDDASLLKKTLKRKEQSKLKSEKEWNERKEGIAKGQAMKQKKREENLKKRRDEKGSKPGKKKGPAKGGKKKRAGFEGNIMGR